MYNSKSFSGKTVLITGCNRGIGNLAMHKFAEYGASIIACVRKQTDDFSKETEMLQEKYKVKIDILYFDLADEEAIKSAFRPLYKNKTEIDILVNNAGISAGGFLTMTSIDKIKEVFQVNFFSLVLVTQMVTKLMMRYKKGSIINLGSIAGLDNYAGYTAYGSSKAAIMAFTKTLSNELSPYNIRVNAVAPGLTNTDMATEMETKAADEMINRSSMKRLAEPQEVVNSIMFLASDDATFINGQIIRVDGGM